jgi:hypothetical protein
MKNILILPLIIFIGRQCEAQTPLVPGEIKGKYETFIINELKPLASDSLKFIDVSSRSNKYDNGMPQPHVRNLLPVSKQDIHVDNDAIKQIVYTVLTGKLAALKKNGEILYLNIKFLQNGNITDLSYTLHENTIITLQDIETIDRQLRMNVKAKFTGVQYHQYEVIYYQQPPSFVF